MMRDLPAAAFIVGVLLLGAGVGSRWGGPGLFLGAALGFFLGGVGVWLVEGERGKKR